MSRATRFIDACYRRPTDCTPVWLMRQAGRYQSSYRELRESVSFLELCQTPELSAKVTVRAALELGVDAAIIFSDILLPLDAMGSPVQFTDEGPHLAAPVRDRSGIDRLVVPEPRRSLPFLLEGVRQARAALDGAVPLLGFAGGPLTLASYLVEGHHGSGQAQLKALLFGDPAAAHALLGKLAETALAVLRAQVEAGCQAVQIFDTWGGILSPDDYRTFGLPYLQQITQGLTDLAVPRILFSTCSATVLELMKQTGVEVISLDWRLDLDEARRRLGPGVAVQGNLDPGCLFLEPLALEARVERVLQQGGGAGHVFNLGHGVLPGTPEKSVRALVETVHRLSSRRT